MVLEINGKGQITLPKDLVKKLHLTKGTRLDVVEVNGILTVTPIITHTKKGYDTFVKELKRMEKRLPEEQRSLLVPVEEALLKLDEEAK